MLGDKLEIIEKKLENLKIQKNRLLRVEQVHNRKRLVKQKIVVGGYFLNKIKSMSSDKKLDLKNNILATIKDSRKSDVEAINNLFSE